MPLYLLYILGAFFLSLLIGRICIPRIIIVSKKKRLLDVPNHRKVHTKLIPRLGGISFFPAIVISYCCTLGIFLSQSKHIPMINDIFLRDMLFFFAGMMVIFIVGLYDDITGMSYRRKFLLQLIAALILVLPAGAIGNFNGLLGLNHIPPVVGIPLTVVVVMAVINSYNLIDGVDGLCSGLSIIACATLGLLFFSQASHGLVLLVASTIGVVTAFFMYNVFGHRLKIFMGDSGSLTMGYVIAFLSLQFIGQNQAMHTVIGNNALIVALGIVFVPLFDTTRLFISRLINGKSPFHPDKNHIHHKFLRLGFNHIQSTLAILGIQILFIVSNLILALHININLVLAIDFVAAVSLIILLNTIARMKGIPEADEEERPEEEREEANVRPMLRKTDITNLPNHSGDERPISLNPAWKMTKFQNTGLHIE